MKYEEVFEASGHRNVAGTHRTTLEITKESHLTHSGTCIVATDSTLALGDLDEYIRSLAQKSTTRIVLRMSVNDLTETIIGWGSPGLTYRSNTCMVARTSEFECDRTLMINADRAAGDLNRSFVRMLRDSDVLVHCELTFISEQ